MKKALFFLLVFLFSTNKLISSINKPDNISKGCSSEISQNQLSNSDKLKIKKIEIDTNNYRGWTVNSIRIITSPYRFIDETYKGRFASTITITYEDDTKCIFNGRVRHSGDAKDHISLQGNSIIQSLDIHLDHGNIRGITKFKLFKEGTRGDFQDVIIVNQLLRNFNYLGPRSIKVNARINQAESVMLFQEKASKELLEFNNRREGPILEADQKHFFKMVDNLPDNQSSNWDLQIPVLENKSIKTMLAKQLNSGIIIKSENHKKMSYEALTNLNFIYLYYSNRFKDDKNNFYFFDYDLDNNLLGFFNPRIVKKLDMYNVLLMSVNAQHGLSASNRKFYWNSLNYHYEPISYDLNPRINSDFATTTTASYRYPVSEHFLESISELQNKLKNLDLKKLLIVVNQSGANITMTELQSKINKISENVIKIKTIYSSDTNPVMIEHNRFKPLNKNILAGFNQVLNEIDPSVYLVHNKEQSQNNNVLKKCKINLKDCVDHYFSNNNLTDLLEGELVINNRIYQYLGDNKDFTKLQKYQNYKKLELENFSIFYEDGIEIENKNNDKIFNIYQKKPGSRAFISNGILNNTVINFYGYDLIEQGKKLDLKTFPPNYPISADGLTGCLSLINLNVKNISIKADKSSCEDAIKFINVKGSVKYVEIKDAFSDGLDVDFSNLKIENINVFSSRNDCSDFSGGEYYLGKLNLINCGDKALSVGEKSNINLNEINAENSNIGVASKDSSIVSIKYASLNSLKTCLSAYNKKQEFDGGFINVDKMICENYFQKADIDTYSKIFEKKIALKNNNYGTTYDPEKLKISQVNGKSITKNFLKDYKALNKDGTANAVIEIPSGVKQKWEVSKENGSLIREFYMGKPRLIDHKPYPVNYGMIPGTVWPTRVGGDGDPLDVIVLGKPLSQGEIVQVKIIGFLEMIDLGEQDDKIVAVHKDSEFAKYENLLHLKSERPDVIQEIKDWFQNYKGKNVVSFIKFRNSNDAKNLISITERYFKRFGIKPRS